jgi:hypothetical protein
MSLRRGGFALVYFPHSDLMIELQLVRRPIGRMPRMEAVDQALRSTLGL